MGKRSKRYEQQAGITSCDICGWNIYLEYFIDRGDMVICDQCGSEYIVQCRNPTRITLLEQEPDDFYGDLDLDFD